MTFSNDAGLMNLQQNKMENLKTKSGLPLNTIGNLEHKKLPQFQFLKNLYHQKKLFLKILF